MSTAEPADRPAKPQVIDCVAILERYGAGRGGTSGREPGVRIGVNNPHPTAMATTALWMGPRRGRVEHPVRSACG